MKVCCKIRNSKRGHPTEWRDTLVFVLKKKKASMFCVFHPNS